MCNDDGPECTGIVAESFRMDRVVLLKGQKEGSVNVGLIIASVSGVLSIIMLITVWYLTCHNLTRKTRTPFKKTVRS